MANIRQSILVRTDLKFPKGLSEAQVSHLHFEHFRRCIMSGIDSTEDQLKSTILLSKDDWEWLKTPYIFVHGIPCLEALNYFIKIAKEKRVPYTEWFDTVFIEVSPTQRIVEHCLVGISLGPCESDAVKSVIGDLPILKSE